MPDLNMVHEVWENVLPSCLICISFCDPVYVLEIEKMHYNKPVIDTVSQNIILGLNSLIFPPLDVIYYTKWERFNKKALTFSLTTSTQTFTIDLAFNFKLCCFQDWVTSAIQRFLLFISRSYSASRSWSYVTPPPPDSRGSTLELEYQCPGGV